MLICTVKASVLSLPVYTCVFYKELRFLKTYLTNKRNCTEIETQYGKRMRKRDVATCTLNNYFSKEVLKFGTSVKIIQDFSIIYS
jgi:hypothetical protein